MSASPIEGGADESYAPSPREFVRQQVERYEATDGAEGYELHGNPCVIITYRGRRSGALRKTPVIRVLHEGRYVLVGSFGGRPRNPLWVDNLRADPDITLRDRAEVFEVSARLVTDPEERARMWASAVAVFPDYDDYAVATERTIPVFVCEPR